ncbi:solute carrier family 25 [Capsaspora owczarzaki ATCC 30864]|uniref:Solute carrier family 25 n=1 Tax=Capsaspora owczarzaki (strain ATCC 30864) TaxID=595528 RepID=A0A0D2VSZ2_CAPO3|nr:solute carrier family 25 [Capsaspora owczarzaki ATCC 30864]KJE94317.1 solute carrier family 25 [Capsaspora owczarzaki ATCC 30864]|eukprot:XP_004346661.1 solute carrier family 25 [Capsaspora owczarzaki ATCC 30864]
MDRFVTGGAAGMLATCVVQPLDLIKTRLQLATKSTEAATATFAKPPAINPVVPGKPNFVNVTSAVLRNEGVLALYSGLSAALFRQLTYTSSRLGVYSVVNEKLQQRAKQHAAATGATKSAVPFYQLVGAGMFAGAVGAVVGTPAEVALVRMTSDGRLPVAQRRNYKNVLHALVRIVREEGVLTLWRGCGPTVSRAMLLNAAQLSTYSFSKDLLLRSGHFSDNVYCHMAASLSAGFFATAVSLPADIAKTRIQDMKAGEYKNSVDCLLKLVRKDGIMSPWRGFNVFFARIGSHTVLTFILLEQITQLVKKM